MKSGIVVLIVLTEKMTEAQDRAKMNMASGIAIFLLVVCLGPVIIFTIKRMTAEIQLYAAEALEKQKVRLQRNQEQRKFCCIKDKTARPER